MKKRVISLFLAAAMTCGLLAGCGSADADKGTADTAKTETKAETNDKKEDSKEEITLRFVDISTSPLRQEYFMSVFEQFEAEQGIEVKYEGVPWDDAADKLTVLGAANDLPDVLTISEKWMGQFISAEWILPLDDLYAEMLEKPGSELAEKMLHTDFKDCSGELNRK